MNRDDIEAVVAAVLWQLHNRFEPCVLKDLKEEEPEFAEDLIDAAVAEAERRGLMAGNEIKPGQVWDDENGARVRVIKIEGFHVVYLRSGHRDSSTIDDFKFWCKDAKLVCHD